MGERTKIQWCDHTFNPWRGCAKIAAGCANCYAEAQAKRMPKVFGEWGPTARRVIASESYWRQPARWNRAAKKAGVRRRVFCGSMMDWLELRPELEGPRFRLLRLIVDTPSLDWLMLTKRSENWERATTLRADIDYMPGNAWLGISCSTQADLDRNMPHLLRCPAAVRFLSLEPLLEDVQLDFGESCLSGECRHVKGSPLSWVIVGGESGPKARPCNVEWIRSIVRQCKAAGVAVFVKQLGARSESTVRGTRPIRDLKGGEMSEWPKDLRIREMPEDR